MTNSHEQITIGLDQTPVGLYQTHIDLDQTTVALNQTAVGLEQSIVSLDKTPDGFDQTTVGLTFLHDVCGNTSIYLSERFNSARFLVISLI